MAFIKVVVALTVLAVASAQQGGYGGAGYGAAAGYGHEQEHYEPAHYSFAYAVKDDHTKDMKEHKETRHGDKTEGEYSFLEADGTTRTVKYVVDGKSGFVAQVIRSGHAVHAAPVKKVALVQPVHHVIQPVHQVAYKPVVVAPAVHQASSYVSGTTYNGARGNNGAYNNAGYSGSSYVSGGNFGQRNNAGGFGGNNAGFGANNGGYGASSYVSGGNFGFGGQQNRAGAGFGGYNNNNNNRNY